MDSYLPIYAGKPEDVTWVGFGSGAGTNLRECARVIPPAALLTDKPSAGLLSLNIFADTPKIVLNGYRSCGSWVQARGDPEREAEYGRRSVQFNTDILSELRSFEERSGRHIDLIVLGGYMRLILDPLLGGFPDMIVNVHPSYLPLTGRTNGENIHRAYTGDDAVFDALMDGARSTRSSVIIVDGKADHGEILTQGPELLVDDEGLRIFSQTCSSSFMHGPVTEAISEEQRAYADGHQSRQKEASDWPALTTALRMIANGRIALGLNKELFGEWRYVFVDGKRMPYTGFEVKP
ncbi:hypothetical protein J4460_08270 [Candidatus Woesearchaeota archaeon]|nr:MAG: hypothetical protein QS99_C0012G0043 [archaeon GW2011_AR4]MBS3130634.1 hypothetical protein [Candidatus Woesearchaeota archaeon]HIH39085.1 hypothetical protein [Candidatus Woesearchaeota archaeon]HIH49324.1 hypothetical protein [Candidatus Woesearchaeota archaeon]HIJ03157.1 hypothetical protein [Candidatus Woesearchaeota archaeon]